MNNREQFNRHSAELADVYAMLDCDAWRPLTEEKIVRAHATAQECLDHIQQSGRRLRVLFQADNNVNVLDEFTNRFISMGYSRLKRTAEPDSPDYQMLYGIVQRFGLEDVVYPDGITRKFLVAEVGEHEYGSHEEYRIYMAGTTDTAPRRATLHQFEDLAPRIEEREWWLHGMRFSLWLQSDPQEWVSAPKALRELEAYIGKDKEAGLEEFVTGINLALSGDAMFQLKARINGTIFPMNPRVGAAVPLRGQRVNGITMPVVALDLRFGQAGIEGEAYCFDKDIERLAMVSMDDVRLNCTNRNATR